jgi:hypothetical protein
MTATTTTKGPEVNTHVHEADETNVTSDMKVNATGGEHAFVRKTLD